MVYFDAENSILCYHLTVSGRLFYFEEVKTTYEKGAIDEKHTDDISCVYFVQE